MTLEVFRHKLSDLMESRVRSRLDPIEEKFVHALRSLDIEGQTPQGQDADWLEALWSEYCTKRPRVKSLTRPCKTSD